MQSDGTGDSERQAARVQVSRDEPARGYRLARLPDVERLGYSPPSLGIIALSIVTPARQFVGRFIAIGKAEPFELDHDCGATTAGVTVHDKAVVGVGEGQGCAATAVNRAARPPPIPS